VAAVAINHIAGPSIPARRPNGKPRRVGELVSGCEGSERVYIRPQRPTVTTGDSAPDQGLLIYFTVIETKVYNIIYYTFVETAWSKKKIR